MGVRLGGERGGGGGDGGRLWTKKEGSVSFLHKYDGITDSLVLADENMRLWPGMTRFGGKHRIFELRLCEIQAVPASFLLLPHH